MHEPTSEDPSATPALLTEQARALVQTEEARIAASQSRATALLAVAGVIASVGGGVLAGLDGRDFALPLDVFGEQVSAVLVAACLTGAIAISCLVWSGILAIGALQERLDPQPQKLTPVVKNSSPRCFPRDRLNRPKSFSSFWLVSSKYCRRRPRTWTERCGVRPGCWGWRLSTGSCSR